MLISITSRIERTKELEEALILVAGGALRFSVMDEGDEFSTLEIYFEESRDITIREAIRAVLAFLHEVEHF